MFRSSDPFLPDYPCIIDINSSHNHRIKSAVTLSYRDPDQAVRDKFLELFKAGHSATQAVAAHKRDLMDEYEDDYYLACADRAVCPDVKWVQNLLSTSFASEFGPSAGDAMAKHLEKIVSDYNTGGNKAVMIHCQNDIIVAVFSTLMQRISGLSTASQICFLDSSGNMDRFNCRVFLLMIDTVVGGLPVGVLVTTSESEAVITAALEEYKKLLCADSFGGRGATGPAVFMTDNAAALRNSLATCFPSSVCLLCIFHVLQATWRWLWDAKHGIKIDDRRECFSYVSRMLYSVTETECAEANNQAVNSSMADDYPNFEKYLSDMYSDRQSWALYRRQELPTKGNNTNNMVESVFRVLKDKVFDRTRAYNVPQLFSFVTDSVDSYFSSKILTFLSGKIDQRSRYQPSRRALTVSYDITDSSNGMFSVHNPASMQTYLVHMTLGICSCPVGITGGPCKHQHAVSVKHKLEGHNSVFLSADSKLNLHWVATGSRAVPCDWYRSLAYTSPRKATYQGAVSEANGEINRVSPMIASSPGRLLLIGLRKIYVVGFESVHIFCKFF